MKKTRGNGSRKKILRADEKGEMKRGWRKMEEKEQTEREEEKREARGEEEVAWWLGKGHVQIGSQGAASMEML